MIVNEKKGLMAIETLGILVLIAAFVVIMLFIYTRQTGRYEQAYVSCEGKGGVCVAGFQECSALGRPAHPVLRCGKEAEKEGRKSCCL